MQSYQFKHDFYFDAGANALGGTLIEPQTRPIPSQASVSLPAAGGVATARTEAFNLEGIISCAATSTGVLGVKNPDGSARLLVTAVVEGLNLLDVVTARLLVAKIAIDIPATAGPRRLSLVGSQIDGLRLGGVEARPRFVSELRLPKPDVNGTMPNLTWEDFERVGRSQADALLCCDGARDCSDAKDWLEGRFGWMTTGRGRDGCPYSLSSLFHTVTAVDDVIPGRVFGHVIELPAFGRIFLGEIVASPDIVQLTMLRAELGCAVSGSASAASVNGNGNRVPPI
jgi:hypothetical protein